MRGSRKPGVAASASATASNYDALIRIRVVVNFLSRFIVVQDRSHRNFKDDVFALAAGFVRAFTVAPALRFVFGIEAEVHQRVVALAGFHVDVAALAAIATGRSAARNIFLAPEGNAAVPAAASFNPDFSLVDEHSQL